MAVLERAYGAIRSAEQAVDVDDLDPPAAIRRLAELTFDHHESHPDFIRLVSIENIHHGEHMSMSATLRNLNSPAIELIRRILERGYASGAFRRPVEAIDLHVMISVLLRLPDRQSPHVRSAVRSRPHRPGAPRDLPSDVGRHGDRLPRRRSGRLKRAPKVQGGVPIVEGRPAPETGIHDRTSIPLTS